MNKSLLSLLLLLPLSACQAADAPPFSAEQLLKPPTKNWSTNGGTLYNQRFSPLDEINTTNVKDLKANWRTHLNGSGMGPPYSGEAQPIVYDGVIYIVTGANDVFAIDVDTGEHLWVYEAKLESEIDTVCCGWTSRGVGLGDGKIFVGQLDGKLLALDQKTGEVVWSTQAERWQDGYTITSAPLYYDGMVITGFAGAEFATRGRVKAYDADSGEHIWTFFTVPGPGETGHESWPANSDAWKHGGGTVWQTPAVDPELGLIYFSTGNPGPDFNGSVRAGDNLFTVSMVAVEAKTGKYRWHFQQVHHDLWDFDSPSPVVLFDLEYDGKMRKGIAEIGKTGWVYILDRVTGEPLVGIEERPVPQEPRQATSPTQPFPIGDSVVPQSMDAPPYGYKLINEGRIFTPFWKEPVVSKPSPWGGTNWPPSSYDPRTGYFYVCANDQPGRFVSADEDDPVEGERYMGGQFGRAQLPLNGIFAAMDLRTNKIVWRQRWKDSCYSGSTATAGDLVFTGRNDGRFVALDSRNGDALWEYQTGAGVNATASVFEHEGRQHVVVYSAGNLFAGTPPGDSVWLFSLDGTMGPADPPGSEKPTRNDRAEVKEISLEGADLTAGAKVYKTFCEACHGENGKGGHGGGPDITQLDSVGLVMTTLMEGRKTMPAFGQTLGEEQIRDVAAFVLGGVKQN